MSNRENGGSKSESRSRFGLFLEGWTFRSRTPAFDIGDEFTAFVTGYDDGSGTPLVRVGDSILRLQLDGEKEDDGRENEGREGEGKGDEGKEIIDTRVRLRVEEYDPDTHTGKAIMLERLGKETY